MKKLKTILSATLASAFLFGTAGNVFIAAEETTTTVEESETTTNITEESTENIEELTENIEEFTTPTEAEGPFTQEFAKIFDYVETISVEGAFDNLDFRLKPGYTQADVEKILDMIDALENVTEAQQGFVAQAILMYGSLSVSTLYDELSNVVLFEHTDENGSYDWHPEVSLTQVGEYVNRMYTLIDLANNGYVFDTQLQTLDDIITMMLIPTILYEQENAGSIIQLNEDLMVFMSAKPKEITIDEFKTLSDKTGNEFADYFELKFGSYDPTHDENTSFTYDYDISAIPLTPGTYNVTFNLVNVNRSVVTGTALSVTIPVTLTGSATTGGTTTGNTTTGTLPNTGENVNETLVAGTAISFLGLAVLALRKRFA